MNKTSAKNVKGFFLYGFLIKGKSYFFRIYDQEKNFTDYEIKDKVNAKFLDDYVSFYDDKTLDFSPSVLGRQRDLDKTARSAEGIIGNFDFISKPEVVVVGEETYKINSVEIEAELLDDIYFYEDGEERYLCKN